MSILNKNTCTMSKDTNIHVTTRKYNEDGACVYTKLSNGDEFWFHPDTGYVARCKSSDGNEFLYNDKGNVVRIKHRAGVP